MFYREAGDFKTSYQDDNQTFPIKFDLIGIMRCCLSPLPSFRLSSTITGQMQFSCPF